MTNGNQNQKEHEAFTSRLRERGEIYRDEEAAIFRNLHQQQIAGTNDFTEFSVIARNVLQFWRGPWGERFDSYYREEVFETLYEKAVALRRLCNRPDILPVKISDPLEFLDWLTTVENQVQPNPDIDGTEPQTAGKKKDKPTHSDDFTSVVWDGKKHTFNKSQALCIKALWENWEKGDLGLSETYIGGHVLESSAEKYRLIHTFRTKGKVHPAWKTMIHACGKGIFKLDRPPKKSSKK